MFIAKGNMYGTAHNKTSLYSFMNSSAMHTKKHTSTLSVYTLCNLIVIITLFSTVL